MSCVKGYYIDMMGDCVGCPLGKYNNVVNSTKCMLCPSGEYTPSNFSKSCIDMPSCGSYNYWDSDTYSCIPCSEPTKTIGVIAWIIFSVSLMGLCCKDIYQWWLIIIPMFIIGLSNTLCDSSISPTSNICMGITCILCAYYTYKVCNKKDPDMNRYNAF